MICLVQGGRFGIVFDHREYVEPGPRSPLSGNSTSQPIRCGGIHPTMAGALAMIAQDAVMLLSEPTQRSRIGRCENAGCRVVFSAWAARAASHSRESFIATQGAVA